MTTPPSFTGVFLEIKRSIFRQRECQTRTHIFKLNAAGYGREQSAPIASYAGP